MKLTVASYGKAKLLYLPASAAAAKGQLISKCFLVSSILPKNELENLNLCPSLLGQKFFVRFLEELKNKNVLSRLTDLYCC
jgi:hypothetical protein